MSLMLRLPLNGTLENKGVNLSEIINNGATINSDGINGLCYQFNGSNNYISISNLESVFTGGSNPFSISFWFYHSGNNRRGVLFGNYGLISSSRFNIEIKADNTLRLWWDGSPDWTISAFIIPTQTWVHCTIVYTGTQVIVYKNNQQIYSTTYTLASKTPIGLYRLGMDSRTGATAFNGRINDFRVYNHALSLKEISEIYNSINLICHYTLNDPYLFVQNNLVNGWNPGNTKVEKLENGIRYTTATGDAYFSMPMKSTLQTTNKYVLSYWCDIQDSDRCSFGFYYSSRMNHVHTAKNGLNVMVFQPGINLSTVTFDDTNRSNSHTFTVTNLKIEAYNETLGDYATPYGTQDNIVYDCAQNNNGIANGQLLVLPVNKKYKYCTKFSGSQYVSINELSVIPKAFSFWLKVDTQPSSNQVIFADGKSKMAFGFYTNGTKIICSAGATSYVLNLDSKFIFGNYWNHIVVQCDTPSSAQKDVYVNGSKLANTTATNNWTHVINDLYIGARNNGSVATYGTFNIQDFRAYNKLLSQNEINEMIHIPINLDNKGNLFLSEINEMEYSNKISFNKFGQIISKNIKEDNLIDKHTSLTKSGNIIVNQIKEK